jgi:hypothetical protein
MRDEVKPEILNLMPMPYPCHPEQGASVLLLISFYDAPQ